MQSKINAFMEYAIKRNPNEPEFIQAVQEVAEAIIPFIEENTTYKGKMLLERMIEPERVISFRVPWVDDKGTTQVNRGFRVEFNSAIGPYKGGLRFHPSVNLSILKFLGFEQVFKNSLTTLPMGGGKGGSDFNPKGKSDNEIMRFCRSLMTELQKYIGPQTDVPAGDIGVGGREIGFMYGQYKRLRAENTGVLTGKGLNWGGSLIRPEATGFGAVYYADEMIKHKGESMVGKTVSLSGFGNVTWGCAIKATELGAKVLTISGPDGYVLDEDGVNTEEKFNYLLELRSSNNDIVAPYAEKFPNAKFFPGEKPWGVKVDMAYPCAIQNELNEDDAKKLIENGCQYVVETSNMGCTADAVNLFVAEKVAFGPGKAANAGGVAVSGLEMSQNAMKLNWKREEVDEKLLHIMSSIHIACLKYGTREDGFVDYVKGANIAGFIKVADAMLDQGVI